jgi:hypothetical protein
MTARRASSFAATVRRIGLSLALAGAGCGRPRVPRPTLLDLPPPGPPPGADEARLMSVALQPDAREPMETAPAPSIHAMARRALDEAQASLVGCYERLLVDHPGAEGSVEVQLDLGPRGGVTRAHLDHRGVGGVEGMLPCLDGVFREIRVRDVPARGQYVSRVYTFSNPPIDRVVAAPVVVQAPPAPARARGRRAPPPGAPPRPTALAPPPGPGSLRADELTRALLDAPALPACASLALRRARRPLPPSTLRMTVAGTGRVSAVALDAPLAARGAPSPLRPDVVACVTDALHALQFRASGITVRAVLSLALRR